MTNCVAGFSSPYRHINCFLSMQAFQFHPAATQWFEQTFGSPTEPQIRGWPAIQSGRHVLISAPTGSGKTLAAFFASLDILFREGAQSDLPDQTQVVYVSPLKALSNDIRKNLQEPLAGIRALLRETEGRDIDVRAEVRTGDTTAAQRQALIKKPPHILVTTPESLRSEEHTSELQSQSNLVCRLLLEKKKNTTKRARSTALRPPRSTLHGSASSGLYRS